MKFEFIFEENEYKGEYTITDDKKFILVSLYDDYIINLIGKDITYVFDEEDNLYKFGISPNVVIDKSIVYSDILKSILFNYEKK